MKTNICRKVAIKIVGNPDDENSSSFDQFILIIIAISSMAMYFENPLNDPNGVVQEILGVLDYVTTAIFFSEVVLRVTAYGFFFNGKKSYLK